MAENVKTEMRAIENTKALEALAGCVGEKLTGYGVEQGALVLRFDSGARVQLHVDVCDELMNEMADVLSAFGRFLGGTLKSVTSHDVRLHGIGEVTISVL
jgi:hypothetical protein